MLHAVGGSTGAGVTVTTALPLIPPALAVTVAVPGATKNTMPLLSTRAIAGALDVHVNGTARVAPNASFATANTCTPSVLTLPVSVCGLTVTLDTTTGGGGGGGTGGVAAVVTLAVFDKLLHAAIPKTPTHATV